MELLNSKSLLYYIQPICFSVFLLFFVLALEKILCISTPIHANASQTIYLLSESRVFVDHGGPCVRGTRRSKTGGPPTEREGWERDSSVIKPNRGDI
ncbi:hypothetical protein BDW74DRAFT_63150 [Aspergillus multicolor]|uniref:uncharacterized protein n=1 Tax=Aspergillus multicolor TaxID=41759 RepID=UPI003CCDDCB4